MTDRPDQDRPEARPEIRREPAVPGTVIPSQEARSPELTADTARPAPAVESGLLGGAGGYPAMPRRRREPEAGIADTGMAGKETPLRLTGGALNDAPGDADHDDDTTVPTPSGIPAVTGAASSRPDRSGDMAVPPARPAADSLPPAAPLGRSGEPEPRRGGFAPMFLGGIFAAGLGAGAAWLAIPQLPPQWQPVPAAPAVDPAALAEAARIAGAEAARAELESSAADIESRLADAALEAARSAAAEAATGASGASLAQQTQGLLDQARQAGADAAAQLLAQAPAGPEPDAAVQSTLAAQARQLAALDQALTELRDTATGPAATEAQTERLQALEQQLSELRDTARPTTDLSPVQTRIDALEQRLAAQAAAVEDLAARPVVDAAAVDRLNTLAADAEAATQRIREAADQAQAQLAEAESRAADLSAAADAAARRARAATAAAALGDALLTGAPRDAALAELAEAGVEPPAALTGPVATLDELAASYPPAARAAVRDALGAETAQGQGNAIGNFLRAQTGARSVTPREGTDADAVLSRAGDAVQRGNIRASLDELSALPEPARPAMAAWIAQAQAYVDAQTALQALVAPPEPEAPGATADDPAPTGAVAAPGAPTPGTDADADAANAAAPAPQPPASPDAAAPSN